MKQKRLALSEETYQAKSLSCFNNLQLLLKDFSFNTIGLYMSTKKEMNTQYIFEYLWEQHKEVYIPKCENEGVMHFYKINSMNDVSIGKYHILEPSTNILNDQLDILIIPLVSINQKGYRLGMGGGYYDRFVSGKSTIKIGIGYEFQKEEFEEENHDLKFDYFVTEKEVTIY